MILRAFFSFVVAIAVALPVAAQVRKAELAGVRNYSKVDATVGCAGATDPSAMKALKAEGYVSVINLRTATEPGADVEAGRAAAQAAGLKYFHFPFNTRDARLHSRVELSRRRRRHEEPAGLRPLRLGQSRGRHVDDQARAAGQVDRRAARARRPRPSACASRR